VSASTEDAWERGPLRPLLAAGAVHVWRADLAAVSPELGELLGEDERERAQRLLSAHGGELWRRSRGLLRTLLGRYLQLEPSSLRFITGEHGKPALLLEGNELSADQPAAVSLDMPAFNMSHSDGLALYAFSHAGQVGVDVEVARRPIDAVTIAARMLGPEQAQRLQALDPELRQREFLRAWVHYEAELKCLGVGIGAGTATAIEPKSWVAEIELGAHSGAAAAVAAERAPSELQLWQWRG
jgi:4'-phosphopantetheinyl transferase